MSSNPLRSHPATWNLLAAAAAGLLLLAAPAGAQTTGQSMDKPMQHGGMGHLDAADQKFMREAAQGGMMEVELGRLATQKAASSDVKAFGQRMVDDHGKANDRLQALATSKSYTLPAGMSPEQQQMKDKLAKLSGAEFDREYMSHMLKDHEKDVAKFEKESTGGKDGDVKSFASTTLPTLREHLKMAQGIDSKMGGSRSAAKSSKP